MVPPLRKISGTLWAAAPSFMTPPALMVMLPRESVALGAASSRVPPSLMVTAPRPTKEEAKTSLPASMVVPPVQVILAPLKIWVPRPCLTRLRIPPVSRT